MNVIDLENLTDETIKKVIDKFKKQKEYRRVYYGNKYKQDDKYRQYVRDYNKVRFENGKLDKGLKLGQDEEVLNRNRAINIRSWFAKTDREDVFKQKYPEEYKIYTDYINGMPNT